MFSFLPQEKSNLVDSMHTNKTNGKADFGVAAQLVTNKSRRNTFVGTPVFPFEVLTLTPSFGWHQKSSVNLAMILKQTYGRLGSPPLNSPGENRLYLNTIRCVSYFSYPNLSHRYSKGPIRATLKTLSPSVSSRILEIDQPVRLPLDLG
jgi:hypothetical protein